MEKYNGKLFIIIGPMFCGKTKKLIYKLQIKYKTKKKICIKYVSDIRYQNKFEICSHDNERMEAISCGSKLFSMDTIIKNGNFDVIAIDEGQFFEDIAEQADKWTNMGKIVIVCALKADYDRKIFPNIGNLLPLSEKIFDLSENSYCHMCAKKGLENTGNFSMYIDPNNGKGKKPQIDIGGPEKYTSVCRKCYYESKLIN
jgi:thymidine kinase